MLDREDPCRSSISRKRKHRRHMNTQTHISPETLEQLKKMLLEKKQKLSVLQSTISSDSPVNDLDRLDDNAASDADAAEENRMITTEVMTEETKGMMEKIESALK